MHQQCARLFKLSTLSLALTLAACGGGSSSSTPDTVVTASRTIGGTAAKGIIKGGTVKVFAVDASGKQGTAVVATGTTDEKGVFSLKIPADVLTFVVEVSGGPGAKTFDEAENKDIDIPDTSFKLRSVVKLASAGETPYSGSVSPLTEMIIKTAESATGGLSANNITSAKTGFRGFFGFDPETVKPVNSNSAGAATASPDEKLQSLRLAAISQMAKDGGLDCAKSTPAEKLSCVIGKIGALGTIGSGGLTVNDALSVAFDEAAATVITKPTINQTGVTTVAQLPKGSVPNVPAEANPIKAATRLFNSLRSNITALSKADKKGVIDIRADAMRADFDKAAAPLDQDLAQWMQMTTRAMDFLNAYKAGTVTSNSLTITVGGRQVGGCSIYADTNGFFDSPLATSVANAVSVGCSGVRKFVPGSFATDSSNTYKRVALAFTIVPVSGSSTSYTYASRARIETWSGTTNRRDPTLDVTVGTYGGTPNRARGTIEYVKTGSLVNSVAFKGMMPARTDAYGVALTDNETWSIAASRTAEGNKLFKYTLAGNITSIKDGQEVGSVSIADGSFLRTEEVDEGSIVTTGIKEFSLELAAKAGGSKVAGKLVLSEAMADKNGFNYQPTKIAFTGSLSTNNAEFFTGTLSFAEPGYKLFDSSQPVSASNVEVQNASLLGKLSVTDRPALIIQLTGTRTRAASDKLNLTGQYNDGSNLVNLGLSVVEGAGTGNQKVLTISSVDGVALTLTDADTVDVLKDGVKVAVLNTKTGMINFTDGSFVSLK